MPSADWETELVNLLEKERKILTRFMDIAHQKTEALTGGNISEIDKFVNIEQPLVVQMSALESGRISLLGKKNFQGLTLSQLVEKSGQKKSELLELFDSMNSLVSELRAANDLNSNITKSRIEFYNFLSGKKQKKNLYENSGRVKGVTEKTGLIDRKI